MLKKSWMNLFTKFIWPRKDCKDFLLDGRAKSLMALTLSRSIAHPSFEMIWLKNLPSSIMKINFFRFREISYLLHLMKAYFRCLTWKFLSYEKIVISSRYTSRLLFINFPNAWSIALLKVTLTLDRYPLKSECFSFCCEIYFKLILILNPNLVVPRETIY